jgi:hypothetical protein
MIREKEEGRREKKRRQRKREKSPPFSLDRS